MTLFKVLRSLLVSEKNGGLVDFDPMQIAHKVIRLINSDALELKMNASREEVVRNYSMNKYVNSLRSMYGDVV